MKILLVALNARYVHTNLAVRYLREVILGQTTGHHEVQIREFSINERLEHIAAEIYEEKPDIIGFSCYIWNMSLMGSLIRHLRLVMPQTYFILGGPEVSFDPENVLLQYPQADTIVVGEGERSVPSLIETLSRQELPFSVEGIVWRLREEAATNRTVIIPEDFEGEVIRLEENSIISNKMMSCLPDLNQLPNPYPQVENFNGKLVYVETSRGCPFNCAFCISSTFRGIRYLDPGKFRMILRQLFLSGAQTIKFVDRTFNANKEHAFMILKIFKEEAIKWLEESNSDSIPRAHCEMAGELLDEAWLNYLKDYPEGMIQLEIGVQSTHQPTLKAVNRPQHFSSWKDKVKFLQHHCHIPVHLDLIAGLPFEGWQEFRNSFDDVFEVRPDHLQLGFLKVLKGSGIWAKSKEYGLVYSPEPPYAILQTRELTHDQLLSLGRIEDILEKYYNSGRFRYSLEYLLREMKSPFDFFHSFAECWQSKGWFKREWNAKALFQNLWYYITSELSPLIGPYHQALWQNALRFDYYLLERPAIIPPYLEGKDQGEHWNRIQEEIRSDPYWHQIIPQSMELDRRQWARATAVARFDIDVPVIDQAETFESSEEQTGVWYLFYYSKGNKTYFRYAKDESNK